MDRLTSSQGLMSCYLEEEDESTPKSRPGRKSGAGAKARSPCGCWEAWRSEAEPLITPGCVQTPGCCFLVLASGPDALAAENESTVDSVLFTGNITLQQTRGDGGW